MMKEKNTLKKFMMFRYTDLKTMCEYLEDMSEKGWALKSMSSFMVEFERIELRKVRYAVELLDTVSAYSDEISENEQEYIDMCEQAGWEFVCNKRQMYIFRTEDENAPEIVSDSEDKLHNIKTGMLKSYFLWWCIFLAWFLFVLLSTVTTYWAIGSYIELSYRIMTVFILIILVLIIYVQILVFWRWSIKAKKALDNDNTIPYVNLRKIKLRKWSVVFSIFLLAVYFTGWIINLEYDELYRGEVSEGAEYTNSGLLLMKPDNIPVSVVDFGAEEANYNSSFGMISLFGSRYEYMSSSDIDDLTIWYEIYYSEFDFLLNSYIDEVRQKRDTEIVETDASIWGAEKAYVDGRGNVIIVYDDYVLDCYYIDDLNSKGNNVADTFKKVFDKVN